MQRRDKEEEKVKTSPEKGAQKEAGRLEGLWGGRGGRGDAGVEQLRKLLWFRDSL